MRPSPPSRSVLLALLALLPGAVLAAGQRLLVMGASGELIVAQAQPEGFEELSRVSLFEGGRNWSRPILVNGIVYCRNSRGALVARDHRE